MYEYAALMMECIRDKQAGITSLEKVGYGLKWSHIQSIFKRLSTSINDLNFGHTNKDKTFALLNQYKDDQIDSVQSLLSVALYLMIMEYNISLWIFARYGVSPQLLHKEHLISELHSGSCVLKRLRLSHPVCEMSDKVKEEVSFWHRYNCKHYTELLDMLLL